MGAVGSLAHPASNRIAKRGRMASRVGTRGEENIIKASDAGARRWAPGTRESHERSGSERKQALIVED
ncbi:hypothetical protein ASA01S_034_00330 [Aeromonas salmonicida subsp. masoucida NBRC 13784]|nr:hypothetical protein ASA01S_034_00330 [Aeromonas salmonicida subsp. masoucida NBRC 13784]